MSVEGYADDNQLLKQFNLVFQFEVLGEGIEHTFRVIEQWMRENFLKLNCGKTKIMVVAPESIKQEIVINGTFLNGQCIRFVENAKNLGVYLDSILSLDFQVQKVVASCFSTIRLLSRIKCFLTSEHLQWLVCALVLGKIDYCNALYFGLKAETINKLQSVQNSAARLACKVNGFDKVRSESLFHELHWLKVKDRISFKVLTIVHKCVYGNAPIDLKNLISVSSSHRTKKLVARDFNGAMGKRAFSVCGPRLWNALPKDLRALEDLDDFKKKLKTFFFTNSSRFYERLEMK